MMVWFVASCALNTMPPVVDPALRVGDPARAQVTTLPAPPELPTWARDMAVGDFDGDGTLELAVSGLDGARDGMIVFYAWSGGGLVETQRLGPDPVGVAQTTGVTGWGGDGERLAVGDFDGDGFDDLALSDPLVGGGYGNYPSEVRWRQRILVRHGSPTGLQPATESLYLDRAAISGLHAVRDPMADGRDRLLFGAYGTDVHTEVSNWLSLVEAHSGVWAAVSDDDPWYVGASGALDVDADGHDEIFYWREDRSFEYWRGWRPPATVSAGWLAGPAWPATPQWSLTTRLSDAFSEHLPTAFHGVADLDLDGLPDLITQPNGQDNALHVYPDAGSGLVHPPMELPLEPGDVGIILPLRPGDTDGDGVVEALTLTRGDGGARLYRWAAAPGGPSATPTEVLDLGVDVAVSRSWVGDLDGDGDDDIVLLRPNSSVHVVWGGPPPACPGGGAPELAFPDDDGDGFTSVAHAGWWCAPPVGSTPTPGTDCDDTSADIFPGSAALRPGLDADCDGLVTCYADGDLDGWYITDAQVVSGFRCAGPRRLSGDLPTSVGDCDDQARQVYPGAPDGSAVDWNCDGLVTCYEDVDGDGMGAPPLVALAVTPGSACPTGWRSPSLGVDCAPTDPTLQRMTQWTRDRDGDGVYGTQWEYHCAPPSDPALVPYPLPLMDCDDTDPNRAPTLPELPGGVDEDCDLMLSCWADLDGDGYGGPTGTPDNLRSCAGAPETSTDCDDNNPNYNPGRAEVLDQDYNCNGLVGCFVDADGDGFGAFNAVDAPACPWPGFVRNAGDCDDTRAQVNPLAVESSTTPYDDNCNGLTSIALFVEDRAWVVVDATPNTPVALAASRTRRLGGSCPPQLGGACLDLVRPIIFRSGRTDANGRVSFPAYLDPIPGVAAWMQAVTLSDGPSRPQRDVLRPGDVPP